MTTFINITFEEWKEKYKPLLDKNGDVCWYDCAGKDLEFVLNQNILNVWTEMESGDNYFVYSGIHKMNRMGYYVTEIPYNENETVVFEIPEIEEWGISEEGEEEE